MYIKIVISTIITSILSGIIYFLAVFNLPNFLTTFLAPIVTAILLSLIFGYLFASTAGNERYPYAVIFALGMGVFFTTFLIIIFLLDFYRPCVDCGPGVEPLWAYVCLCMLESIFAAIIGLCVAFSYRGGMKIKQILIPRFRKQG